MEFGREAHLQQISCTMVPQDVFQGDAPPPETHQTIDCCRQIMLQLLLLLLQQQQQSKARAVKKGRTS